MSDIGKRVKQRLLELGMSEYAAAKSLKMHYSNIQGLTAGRVKKPRYLGELAEVLQVNEKWLRTGEPPKEIVAIARKSANVNSLNQHTSPRKIQHNNMHEPSYGVLRENAHGFLGDMARTLPVFGTAAAGAEQGAFQISSGGPIDYVFRPMSLQHNQDAFAIYVEGISMEPKFEAGDLIFIDSHRAPRPYDYVVIELLNEQGEREAFIKRYLGQKDGHIICMQYNPHKERYYPVENIIKLHRVFTNNELFSV